MLNNASIFLKKNVPPSLLYSNAALFNIANNQAQLMNRESNVEGSLACLSEAIEIANDPRVMNRQDLPLAETHLNLSNALTFLLRHQDALYQAEKANIISS